MNRRLRVLEVTKSTAGVAEYVRWLVNGLDPEQFDLTVICLSEGGDEFAAELAQKPGVKAFSLAMKRYQIDPLSDARLALNLKRIIRKGEFDLVHAHASKPGFLARLAAAGSGVPVIYSPHCFAFHAGTGRLKASGLAGLERLAARFLTARIMTVADGERILAQQYHVGRPDQFVTVHSGVDLLPFRQPVDQRQQKIELGVPVDATLVGSVGRLSPQKAPLDFVHMAARVHQRLADVHFVWIGSGPLEGEAQALVAELGLGDVFHFAGQRGNIPEVLQALDCFVLAAHWEGFPIVLLEAMAAGLPVVATDISGNNEAIRDGIDGRLAPVGNSAALAEAVLDVLCNPELARSFAASARWRVEKVFTRQAMLEGVARLYHQVTHCREVGFGGMNET
jgi:glycosyltransferase involved in cell wall biosynthesis